MDRMFTVTLTEHEWDAMQMAVQFRLTKIHSLDGWEADRATLREAQSKIDRVIAGEGMRAG